MQRVAVVGASLAGVQAAQTLRRQDFEGEIALIGDEPHYPYDRPPLSKEYLAGSFDTERLRLRPTADPDQLGVEWHLGVRAQALHGVDVSGADGFGVELDDGTVVEADGVVVATGARARNLPGADAISGVHVLRSLDDAQAIRSALAAGPRRVVVVGCGFIGAEVAATAREQGLEVTIIEAAPIPLGRVLDESGGMAIADLHRSHGVDVRLSSPVAGFDAPNGTLAAVELDSGESIEADLVVVGIGVVPNTEWLEGSGLTVDDGVVCDETSLAGPGVVAVGDVARWPNPRFGRRLARVEQWDNAVDMGSHGAKRLLAWSADAPGEPYQPVPWFWSDQYDRKIQLAGIPGPVAEVVQGTVAEQRFVQLYLDTNGRPTGALAWNRPRQAIMARQLIGDGAEADELREKLA